MFWKKFQKINFITCPTNELKKELIDLNLFAKKIYLLRDAIINFGINRPNKRVNIDLRYVKDKKIILAVGRLITKKFSLSNKRI